MRSATAPLRPGAQVPSTRDLARQLGVSRRVVVDAYGQLAAKGYLLLRQGARPQVSEATAAGVASEHVATAPARPPRYDFRPSVPDVSDFPRSSWRLLAALRHCGAIADLDLGYGDPLGVEELRSALSDYLGRVRGVVAEPGRVIVTSGYTQGLAARGARARPPVAPDASRSRTRPTPSRGTSSRAPGSKQSAVGVDEPRPARERARATSTPWC